jgi:MFS family permease
MLTATPLLTALVWTMALVVRSEPFSPASALLLGVGLLATATVATVGMIVVGGRWAHRLGLASLVMSVALAIARDIDFAWVVGTVATVIALMGLLSPTVTSTIRKLPSASGPPPTAIAPPILLLITPALLGFVGNEATPWALLLVGLSAPNAAFLYSRVIPGGLLVIRLVWPVMTLALTPVLGWIAGAVAAALAIAVGVTAWDSSVKASYHPPREEGTTLRMPTELTPREVLDAAQIDEKGHRT